MTTRGIPAKNEVRSLGRCPCVWPMTPTAKSRRRPVLGSEPLVDGVRDRAPTCAHLWDRLTVDKRTRTPTGVRNRALTGAHAKNQPTVDNGARTQTGVRPEPQQALVVSSLGCVPFARPNLVFRCLGRCPRLKFDDCLKVELPSIRRGTKIAKPQNTRSESTKRPVPNKTTIPGKPEGQKHDEDVHDDGGTAGKAHRWEPPSQSGSRQILSRTTGRSEHDTP